MRKLKRQRYLAYRNETWIDRLFRSCVARIPRGRKVKLATFGEFSDGAIRRTDSFTFYESPFLGGT